MASSSQPVKSPNRSRTRLLRRLTQAGFGLFIVGSSIRHYLVTTEHVASIDAYCPFGGIATLWRWVSTGGLFVQKTHQSNLVLLLGLIAGVILAGGAFCGWICPFGALQDLLDWIRKKLRLPELRIPPRLDRVLTYGRYVTLGVILYATIATVKLWFADWDPYRTIFSLGWLFEFNLSEQWLAYAVALVILVGALLIPRFWCRYLCPLGGAISLLGNLSLLRIRRNDASCKSCAVCNAPCPVKIDVAQADSAVSADCIGCLECVEVCPREGALSVTLGPALPKILRPQKKEDVA
ncbi:MAG: 4Fe-4S binding protein [Anaerolineae bacterium]|jgi:NapH/MauN family ferredoxin-type protein